MSRIVCAIDDRPATQAVIRTARALATVWDAEVVALHAHDEHDASVQALADAAGVTLAVREGTPVQAILGGLTSSATILGVCGCRSHPLGPRPGGHTAIAVASAAAVPVAMVPPDFPGYDGDRIASALAPLDGTEGAAEPVHDAIAALRRAGAEVTVLHVLGPRTVPAVLDQPYHGLEAWRSEFLNRHAAGTSGMELRAGDPSSDVLAVAEELAVGLIVVGWSQRLDADRARVVRSLLAGARVPVLLVPLDRR